MVIALLNPTHAVTGPATCVVVSGGYEDDVDNGEELIYTGQGGNDINGSRKQVANQKLTQGNQALTINHDKSAQ